MSEHDRDPLEDAIESLRAFGRELPPDAARTRQQVLSSVRVSKQPRFFRGIAAVLALAFGATAFAHFTGQLPALTRTIGAWIGLSSVSHHATTRGREPEAAATSDREPMVAPRQPAAEAQTGQAPQPVEASPSAAVRVTHEPARTTAKPVAPAKEHAEQPATGATAAGPVQQEPDSKARALYLIAHRAHFGGGSPEETLRAWDAFLAAAPADAFAPEARYNRAILLLKLQRFVEAFEALKPFACAAPGSYRQREASVLIARARAKQPQLPAPACEGKPR